MQPKIGLSQRGGRVVRGRTSNWKSLFYLFPVNNLFYLSFPVNYLFPFLSFLFYLFFPFTNFVFSLQTKMLAQVCSTQHVHYFRQYFKIEKQNQQFCVHSESSPHWLWQASSVLFPSTKVLPLRAAFDFAL